MYLCLCSDGEYQQTGVNNRVNKFDNKLIIIFFQKWNLNIFEEVSNYVAFVNNNKWGFVTRLIIFLSYSN